MWKLASFSALGVLALAGGACSSSSPGTPQPTPGGSAGAASDAGSAGSSAGNANTIAGSAGVSSAGAAQGGSGGAPPSAGAGASGSAGAAGAPAAVDFGPNVLIFDPATPMATIQAQISGIADKLATRNGQFSTDRYAYLFKPGKYQLDVKLGFYMQVAGLGQAPDDVQITGAVRSRADWNNGNATLNFWRSAENLATVPTAAIDNSSNVWAVSQGTALRRVHMKGPLNLSDGGYASGGFIADAQIEGPVASGSQQQFFSRNASWSSWTGGVWNMVFAGINPAPTGAWPASPYTVIAKTPSVREKPYLTIDANGHYAVNVPALRTDALGPSFAPAGPAATAVPIEQFYIAKPSDTSSTLNAALAAGKHLLFTPGIYHLAESLKVTKADTLLFGLGLATLLPDNGTPALSIADVDGVKVVGLIVDAGPMSSSTLVEVGPSGSNASHAADPSSLHDLFCRVGGGSAGLASSCVTINSNDVQGDDLWMWRADHGAGAGWASNTSKNGLIVNGNDVTMYGLFVEHFQEYQTLWNGNGGRTYFYQSELPYDPPTQADWQHDGVSGFASYKVAASVTTHEAWGLGIYSAFRQAVACENAIEAPSAAGVVLHHKMTSWLNGNAGSSINHVLNGTGNAATTASRQSISAD